MKIIDRKFLNTQTYSVHAASIAFFKGEPVFAWFGSDVMEGSSDTAIYVQYKDKVQKIKDYEIAHWNPVLFVVEDRLFLSYKIGRFCDCWQTIIAEITNLDGFMESGACAKQIIPAGLNFCTKTKPLVLGNKIYCGSSVETFMDWSACVEMYSFEFGKFSFLYRSPPLGIKNDGILDFRKNGSLKPKGVIQPTLWMDDSGCLDDLNGSPINMLFRSCGLDNKIYVSNGFVEPKPTSLPNPNSSVDVVYYNKNLYLASNPSETSRNKLVVQKIEEDEDGNWENGTAGVGGFRIRDTLVISEKEGQEYSYPFMVENNGLLHLVYTHQRTKIEYVKIEV